MTKFKTYTVQDVIDLVIDYRGKTPKKLGGDWSESGYRAFSAKNVKTGKIVQPDTIRYVSEDMYKKWMKDEIKRGDILITSEAPFGQIYYWDSDEKIVLSQRLFAVRCKETFYDKYIYFYMTTPLFQGELENRSTGTTVTGLRQPELLKTTVIAPGYDTQVKIADFLYAIETKMNINEQINRNLLEQVIAVFKEKIWSKSKNGTIGDYCIMKSGFAFKSSWWTDEGVKVIKIGDINQDNLILATCSHVNEDKVEKAGDFSVKAGDLVLAMTGATIGKFAMVPERSETILVNQRVGKFFLGEEPLKKVPFIYCTLKMDDVYSEVIGRGQGSAQPNISGNDVMTIPCVIPTDIEIDKFNEFAEPIFVSIVKNQNENEKLANLRDGLLPKLMSGEIDVKDLNI